MSAHDRARTIRVAIADGARPVGEEAGLPLHRFPLEQAADAHAAVISPVADEVTVPDGGSLVAAPFAASVWKVDVKPGDRVEHPIFKR